MYKPLPDYLTIERSTIDGLGLFALEDINKNTIIGITHVYSSGYEDSHIRTPLGCFINHSESPNCILGNEGFTKILKTVKNISKGEEITLKYSLYKIKSGSI